MKFDFKSKGMRIAVGIGVPAICILGAWFLYTFRMGPPCVFYKLTNIYCTGCGAGRACVALLYGDILGALDYNIFFVLILPFLAYWLCKIYIAYVFKKDILPFFKVNIWTAVILAVIIVLFTVLRNIPVFPFTYLAP